jgi:hypothetical protein
VEDTGGRPGDRSPFLRVQLNHFDFDFFFSFGGRMCIGSGIHLLSREFPRSLTKNVCVCS